MRATLFQHFRCKWQRRVLDKRLSKDTSKSFLTPKVFANSSEKSVIMSNNSNDKSVSGSSSIPEENAEDLEDLRRSSRRKRARVSFTSYSIY